MDFYLLLKTWAIRLVKNFLIVLKNLQKELFKKQLIGDLIGNKIADKTISVSKKSSKE